MRRSESFQRATSNAIYNLSDTAAMPILMLVATPLWVDRLGLERFGIWMLVNALTGVMGVFNLGVGDATIKFVSSYRGENDFAGLARSVRSSLTLSAFLAVLTVAIVFLVAPFLSRHLFRIPAGEQTLVMQAFQIGGIGLALRTLEAVFLSTLRGLERYDIAVKITITSKIVAVGSAVVLVIFGYGVLAILAAMGVVSFVAVLVEAAVVRRFCPGLSYWPEVNYSAIREIFGFGVFSWLQSVAAVIFSQADRLLIGAMLGAGEVGVYTVCIQFAQQIHALTAAAFNFVFPAVSSRYAEGAINRVRRVFVASVAANVLFAFALTVPLILLGKEILALYLGRVLPSTAHELLVLLSIAFLLLSINVVPHYTLLGMGKVRFVAAVNIVGGLLSLLATAALIPIMGTRGAAVGRLLYGPVISVNFIKVVKSLQ